MRQPAGELPDRFHLLRLPELFLNTLAAGQIPNKAGEYPPTVGRRFSDRQLHGKYCAVLSLARNDPSNSDNAPFASAQIVIQVPVMRLAMGRGHQDLDVGSNDLAFSISEQAFCGCAERGNHASFIDHHHCFGNRLENRPKMCLARRQFGLSASKIADVAVGLIDHIAVPLSIRLGGLQALPAA